MGYGALLRADAALLRPARDAVKNIRDHPRRAKFVDYPPAPLRDSGIRSHLSLGKSVLKRSVEFFEAYFSYRDVCTTCLVDVDIQNKKLAQKAWNALSMKPNTKVDPFYSR